MNPDLVEYFFVFVISTLYRRHCIRKHHVTTEWSTVNWNARNNAIKVFNLWFQLFGIYVLPSKYEKKDHLLWSQRYLQNYANCMPTDRIPRLRVCAFFSWLALLKRCWDFARFDYLLEHSINLNFRLWEGFLWFGVSTLANCICTSSITWQTNRYECMNLYQGFCALTTFYHRNGCSCVAWHLPKLSTVFSTFPLDCNWLPSVDYAYDLK